MVAIFVILTVVTFLVIDLVVAARGRATAESRDARTVVTVAGFDLARDRAYHPGHAWAKRTGRRLVQVGVDHFAARLVGRTDRVSLPDVGQHIAAGRPIATLWRNGRRAELLAPVSGRVTAINRQLVTSPHLAWREPYAGGWLVEIDGERLSDEIGALRSGAAARRWMDESAAALHRFFAPRDASPVAADGGLAVDSIGDLLDEAAWRKARALFLCSDGD